MPRLSLLLPVLACVPSLSLAQAARTPRAVQVVVSGGLQVPTGGFADVHDLGTHADASLVINALGGLRLRPEVTYARFNVKPALGALVTRTMNGAQGAGGGTASDVAGDAVSSFLGGFANLEFPLGPAGFQPFLLAGVGAVNLRNGATATGATLSDVQASLNLGAGLRFRLGAIGGLIEARITNIPAGDARAYFKDVRTIPVTFGLVF